MDCSNQERRRITGDFAEQDVFTGWRELYCYTQRAGVTSAIKRKARRRERREHQRETEHEYEDWLLRH